MLEFSLLKKLRITEKATRLSAELNQYTFIVSSSSTKYSVAKAVGDFFKVKVSSVNIINWKGKKKVSRSNRSKMGQVSGFKKAIVSLPAGEKIELV